MSVYRQLATRLLGHDSLFVRRTFGGVHPPAFKQHSLRSRIMDTPIPAQLHIPLNTTQRESLSMLVAIGERVRKYQKLAEVSLGDDHGTSLPVHAPTSGVMRALALAPVADHESSEQLCLTLEADGQDESIALRPEANAAIERLSGAEIQVRIRDAGILGMGGAGFPTAVKIESGKGFGVELLIINCAECEPYISADEALIRERAEHVVAGAELLRRACSARRLVIAIEDSKNDAIAALRQALESETVLETRCELIVIPAKYPAGSERQLIECLTGVEVPSAEYPTGSGILVQNCGTAHASYEAVVLGRPCISRITTLCGEALLTPKNFEVLLGSSVDFLFDLCGLKQADLSRSVLGGSLMGRELASTESVVCKTTNCLIAAGRGELPAAPAEQACIRCGFCADVCPARLLPQQLLAHCKTGDSIELIEHGLLDCIECGACDYVCPSHIPLVSAFKDSKLSIDERQRDRQRSKYWQNRFQFRQYRIKKDKEQSLASRAEARKSSLEPIEQAASEAAADGAGGFSKEQASREIAAAVARVKARRGASSSDKDESK